MAKRRLNPAWSAGKPEAAVSAAPIVQNEALRKSFGDIEVLNGIDLTVMPGEVIANIDRSGSGKSTLLRCINGQRDAGAHPGQTD